MSKILCCPFYLEDEPVEIEFTVHDGDVEALDAVRADGTHVRLDDWQRCRFENDLRPMILGAILG